MERISFATLIKHTGDVYKNEKSIETDAIEGLNPEIYANFREKISLSFRESSFGSFARSKKALSWLYSTLCDLNIRVARDRRIASRIYIIFSTADKFIIRGLIFFYFRFQFWAAYVPCSAQHKDAVQLVLEQIDVVRRLTEKYNPELVLCTTPKGMCILLKF